MTGVLFVCLPANREDGNHGDLRDVASMSQVTKSQRYTHLNGMGDRGEIYPVYHCMGVRVSPICLTLVGVGS